VIAFKENLLNYALAHFFINSGTNKIDNILARLNLLKRHPISY